MSLARASSAPRKIPGNASTLLIWFGKSLRPVPTMYAPPAFASSGKISGVGFAIAKMTGFSFMVAIHSFFRTPGADTPTNTSIPTTASSKVPVLKLRFVTFEISTWRSANSGSVSEMMPVRSTTIRFLMPAERNIWLMAIPAAPPPLTTTWISSIFLPVRRKEL
ncbi:hypothetical protein SDC9_134299 [bioreactor metagenome]|uniref:Uncharacterized protein n=1 Tax=bioreactor metagenome TaxID=1076179 RepID=A0A645DDC8_9ZZZZ